MYYYRCVFDTNSREYTFHSETPWEKGDLVWADTSRGERLVTVVGPAEKPSFPTKPLLHRHAEDTND